MINKSFAPAMRPIASALALLLLPSWLGIAGFPGAARSQDGANADAAFERAVARRSVRENCLICHSVEIISHQRLTPEQWKAEVEKMAGWGSPIPEEERPFVIDFLASEFATGRPAAIPSRIPSKFVAEHGAFPANNAPKGDPAKGGPLYAKNCANCHGPEGQGADLGPNLAEKLVLWRPSLYHAFVNDGQGRMPGFASVLSEQDGQDLLAWLRSRAYQPPRPEPTK